MSSFKHISPQQTKVLIDEGTVTLVDIRDSSSFQTSHIKGAEHLDNHSLTEFLKRSDEGDAKHTATVVCCYHGNSSQSAAQFLAEKGFSEVYSLDGGFEQWRQQYSELCT